MAQKNKITKALLKKANRIRLLAMDVDGVLTGGEIIILNNGEEIKIWSVKDRMGFAMLKQSELDVKLAWITARASDQVQKRAEDIGVHFIYQKCSDKWLQLEACAKILGLKSDQVAYIGDDFVDLRCLKNSGLSVCPPESPQVLKSICDYETVSSSGKGVVREVIEIILKAQGKWEQTMRRFSAFWIFLFLTSMLMISACHNPIDSRPVAARPDQTIENFTITETSAGLPSWIVNSKMADIYNKKQRATLEEVSVQFMKSDPLTSTAKNKTSLQKMKDSQMVSAYLTAANGEVQLKSNDLSVWGNVVVKTENGTQLFTERLRYSTKNKHIYTDNAVKIIRNGSILIGEGLEATSDLSTIKIFRHQASIQPKELASLKK